MTTSIGTVDQATVQALLAEVSRRIRSATALEEAAQSSMECFQHQFADSVVLARVYATVPYHVLSEPERAFVQAIVRGSDQASTLKDDTQVLSLLGTAGVEPAWCDRHVSSAHLAIPLLSEHFVAGIPMIAGLIRQLGRSVDWYASLGPKESAGQFGVFAESFFVRDAATSHDEAGRLLIPAQDFVQRYGVRTVIGVGGQFAGSGMTLVCIFFNRGTLLEVPQWLMQLPMHLGTTTRKFVETGRIYR